MSSNRHRHSRFKQFSRLRLLMLETNCPVVLTFLTFFLTLNPINSRRKEKGLQQLSHIQLHEKKVTQLLDKELIAHKPVSEQKELLSNPLFVLQLIHEGDMHNTPTRGQKLLSNRLLSQDEGAQHLGQKSRGKNQRGLGDAKFLFKKCLADIPV